MEKILTLFLLCLSLVSHAQFGKLLKKVDSSLVKNQKNGSHSNAASVSFLGNPTNIEIQGGLKQALQKGLLNGVSAVSSKDGFFKNQAIKLLFPPEAKKIESTLRELGFDHTCDEVILTMNRAAENASKKAVPIFLNALSNLSFQDANAILTGNDRAATEYFQKNTSESLKKVFRPEVDSSLNQVGANTYWNTATTTYNKVPFVAKINPDLGDYVTQQCLTGLFYMIAQEELKIRKDLGARTSPLMKKVFAFADAQKH